MKFTKKSSLYPLLVFTQSQSGSMNMPPQGFIQKVPGSYKSERSINIPGNDQLHLKYDCTTGGIVNCIREPILYSFALDKPQGHKI